MVHQRARRTPLRRLPRVAIVIPARNEAEYIGAVVESFLRQEYAGARHIFIVDDHSSDDTLARVLAVSRRLDPERVTALRAGTLPLEWKGKMWALQEGIRAAQQFRPDYYLFADADVVHNRDSLESLISRAECYGFDLVSYMVKLRCESFAERFLIPAFTFFFFMLYPPRWVRDKDRKTAAAAGGCIAIRAAALRRIGGITAIRDQLIDDCALAAAVKRSGGKLWLGQTGSTRSIRKYSGFTDIYRLISRTAFTQLKHSPILLLGTMLAMACTYFVPPIIALRGGWATLLAGLAWLLMSAAYWPTLRFYNRSPLWAPFLPLVALFYLVATLQSAFDYWSGSGGRWKGRVQDPIQVA